MNNETNLRQRVDALWAMIEAHYGPSLNDADDRTMRHLDETVSDGTLTQSVFEQTKRKLITCPRSYGVNHATCDTTPAFWRATDENGRTNLAHRKSINGHKHIVRRGRLWRVTIGTKANRVVRDFTSATDAHLFRDVELERLKSDTAMVKSLSQDPYRTDDQQRSLRQVHAKAAQRKAALRKAMQPDPITGVIPSWSKVLQGPDFAFSNAGPEVDPRSLKVSSFA